MLSDRGKPTYRGSMVMIRRRRSSNACRAITIALWLFSAIYSLGNCEKTEASTTPRLLTHVEQVRHLSQTQAALAIPVRITGVITAFSGYKNSFFLQDKKFGISVDRTDDAEAHVGDEVEVTGTSSAGLFAPLVMASLVHVIGHASPPIAPSMRYSDLLGGAQDSKWIELEGVVHSAHREELFGHPILHISLEVDGQTVGILLQDFQWVDENHLIDSTVRVRGVCSTDFNVKRQFVAASLFVPQREDFEVLQSTGSDPFAVPIVPIRNVFQFGQALHRVKVVGISTYQDPGHVLYLQDGNDGIRIQTSSKEPVKPGQRVEVLGFPAMGDYSPMLTDGSMRIVGSTDPILPMHVEVGKVIRHQDFEHAPYDEQLVEVQGQVVEDDMGQDVRVLVLRGDDQIFEASLQPSPSMVQSRKIEVGSVISVTGICNVHANAERSPNGFTVLMRSPNDIVVLARSSWWTRAHTSAVLITLLLFVSATGLWVIVLRYRVRQQTRVIRESEHRFRNLAETDFLTGLPNRLMLEERIAECLSRSKSSQLKAAILTIDIDRFKQINDTYGHDVGDECLKIVAQRLRSRVRKVDAISRTGGEEFTEVIGCLADMESALRVANGILELFLEPVALADCELKITVSIGAALYPNSGTDIPTLRKQADQALYEAKRLGRNRVVFASKDLSDAHALSTSIEHALAQCIEDRGFYLCYEPISDASGTIFRFEALIRSTNLTLSQLGPSQFIPVAERCALIIPIGLWVVEEVCRQIAEWRLLGHTDCPISINISSRELLDKGFVDHVLEMLDRFQIPHGRLQMELTETTIMTEVSRVAETMTRLAGAGVTFAIDYFGVGYPLLSTLHELPIEMLKIDRSFVKAVQSLSRENSVVRAMIQMAKSMNLQVVAEGIETDEQFAILRSLGCDLFQGHLFMPTLAADQVIPVLEATQARQDIQS